MLRRLLRRLKVRKLNPKALAIQPEEARLRRKSKPNFMAS